MTEVKQGKVTRAKPEYDVVDAGAALIRAVVERELCWFNRFSLTEPHCPNPGRWHKPNAHSEFGRATVWCDEHRHGDDIPKEPR